MPSRLVTIGSVAADSPPLAVIGPARTVAPRFHSFAVVPVQFLEDVRSTPRGIGSAGDRVPAVSPKEHPTALGTSTVSFEAQLEPQNVSTLEPVSPV